MEGLIPTWPPRLVLISDLLTSVPSHPTCIADLILRTETTEEPVQCARTLEIDILKFFLSCETKF